MITEVQDHPEAGVGTLVGGIVDDFRDLVKNELLLARQRIVEDLRKTREASLIWALGLGSAFIAAIAVCLMLANLLHTVTTPAGSGDPAALPMWGCYGIVGILFAIGGAAGIMGGQKKFDSINLIDNQFNRAVKEISK